MSSDAGRAATPLPISAAARTERRPAFPPARDDFSAFRAIEPGTHDLVVLRPSMDGLYVERRDDRELVPWTEIDEVDLAPTDAGRAKVPTASVRLAKGVAIDFADALAPGADDLPLTLGPGRRHLLRVERCRMLAAVVASGAGLERATPLVFRRGPRGVEVPELAIRPRVLPRWAPPIMLAASVGALVLFFGVRWTTASAITAVLVTHELGHAFAMRMLGMKVRGVVFVPLLGAATLPEHSFSSRWDEARVVLAGPATGLPVAGVFALIVWLGGIHGSAALGLGLAWALGVNLFNLVPVLPLDGGRVLACLAAGLPYGLRVIVTCAPILILATALCFVVSGPAWIAAAVFVGIAVSLTRTTLRRQAFLSWMDRLPQPLAAVRAALRDVTHAFTGRAREDVDGGVAPTPMTFGETLAVLGVLFAESIALIAAAAVFVHTLPNGFEWFRTGG